MSPSLAGGGGIDVELAVESGRIVDVTIANRRPLGIASRLAGYLPSDALRLVTRLFSVCRIAQGLAGAMAMERAQGVEIDPSQKAARAFLLRGETVLEHSTCVLLNWPSLQGQRTANLCFLSALRASLGELWRSVYPDGDWMRPGGGRLAPDKAALAAKLDAVQGAIKDAHLATPLDPAACRDWIGGANGPAAGLLRMIEAEQWQGCGASGTALLNQPEENALERRLAHDADGAFTARPEWEGSPRETGPLARRWREPVLLETVAQHGSGLAAHFLAQCVDTICCLEEMQNLVDRVQEASAPQTAAADGAGLGLVETARGWLAHRVEIADGRIRRYQILAPTEWNFHPRGALARGLVGSRTGPTPECLAELLVAALDPCVPARITMRN